MKITPKHCLDGVTLELTLQEARLLRSICRCITGDVGGPRAITNDIEQSLGKMGIGSYDLEGGQIHLPTWWSGLKIEMDDGPPGV